MLCTTFVECDSEMNWIDCCNLVLLFARVVLPFDKQTCCYLASWTTMDDDVRVVECSYACVSSCFIRNSRAGAWMIERGVQRNVGWEPTLTTSKQFKWVVINAEARSSSLSLDWETMLIASAYAQISDKWDRRITPRHFTDLYTKVCNTLLTWRADVLAPDECFMVCDFAWF